MVIGIDASRAFSSFWGGPEAYSYCLIRAILRLNSGHAFRLYFGPGARSNPRFQRFFSDLPIINCQLSIVPWPRLWTQAGLALECLRHPPDVLFVPAHTLPIIRRPNLRTVVTIHDLGAQFLPNYHRFPQKYYLNFMTEYAVHQATKIIAVSEYTKKDIIKKFQISKGSSSRHPELFGAKDPSTGSGQVLEPVLSESKDSSGRTPQNDGGGVSKSRMESKIDVVHEGFDRGTFYPRNRPEIDSVKKKLGVGGEYFLFVGTIQPRKNIVSIVGSFSRLITRFTRPGLEEVSLVLAGSPGWMNEEIYAAPKRFGVEDRVKFVGHVEGEQLAALMSGALALVFPSLYEGFGLSPLEAMACGAPTILSKTTSLPEVGGQAVLYVDPQSVEEIADQMNRVLDWSREEREIWSQRSLAQASKFSWEKAAQETLKVLEGAFK